MPIGANKNNVIVIYPSFTQSAYQPHGFYDYYAKTCGTQCLTVNITKDEPNQMSSSRNAYKLFKANGYKLISDQELDASPEILKQYHKVIVLHNEYVTETEYNAITTHPNVLYLYPNSLYAKVSNNHDGTITLLRGHGYQGVANGFDAATNGYEYDRDCSNIKFLNVTNGMILNCYPEYSMTADPIWNEIQLP